MTSPTNGAYTQNIGVNATVPQPLLSRQQKIIVNTMYLASLTISLAGLGLTAGASGFYNSDLKNSGNMIISSLRFPCMIFGMSFLCCSEFVSKYFKKTNQMQRGLSPFLMQEINRQVEEKVANLTPDECTSLEQRR